MSIKLNADEKRQLKKNAARGGWSITNLESADEQPWSFYHNPKNGKEMWLPADAWNLQTYRSKGYKLGKAPGNFTPVEETTSPEVLPSNLATIVKDAVEAALKAAGVALPASNEISSITEPVPSKEPVQLRML